MIHGMLWHDSSQILLIEKIRKAAYYYDDKYGYKPTICYINQFTCGDADIHQISESLGIEIRISKIILANHLWIGIQV